MLRQVHLGEIHPEIALHPLRRPFFDDITIEDLILPRRDLALHALEGGREKIGVPLGIPDRLDLGTGGIDGASDGGGARGIGVEMRLHGEALAELIRHAPPGDLEEPAFERAARRVVPEAIRPAGNREEGLLEGVIGLGIGEAGAAGEAVDEFCVGPVELLPMPPVRPIGQAIDQAAAGGGTALSGHGRGSYRPGPKAKIFLQIAERFRRGRRVFHP